MKRAAAAVSAAAVGLALAAVPSPAAAAGSPCIVAKPGYAWCVGNVTFSSYYLSRTFQPFQATSGTSWQRDIVITFSPYVKNVRAWANDPDFQNNRAEALLYSCCWLPITSIAGDGNPGVFSVGGGGGLQNGPFTHVRLRSDPSDYVNWRVEYQRSATATWCKINASSGSCDGASYSVSPFWEGSNFDPFQSQDNNNGAQVPIDVTFERLLYSVSATAIDADYDGTKMEAYGADGSLLNTVDFAEDGTPGWTTTNAQSLTDGRGIKRIRLIPAGGDYVVFQGITATPL